MAGVATATVTFAPRSTWEELHGPVGSRLWRPGFLACLVERHRPVWVITPIGFAAGGEPARLVVPSLGESDYPCVADLVVVMSGLFGGSDRLRGLAMSEGLLHQSASGWWVEPSIELPLWGDGQDEMDDELEVPPVIASDTLYEEARRVVAERCRVTVMAYPDSVLVAERSVAWLRGSGIDVDEFGLCVLGESNES